MPQSLTSKQQYWTEVLESADSSGLPLVEFARAPPCSATINLAGRIASTGNVTKVVSELPA